MDEEKLKALLTAHEQRVNEGLAKMGAAMADALRDSARIAEEGPRERWRQNLAASIQLTLLKEHFAHDGRAPMSVFDAQAIAVESVKHADALLAAIEKKA